MDEQSPLDELEQKELRSCIARNYATTAALVSVGLLAFSIMLRVLTGQYDSQPPQADTVGTSGTYYQVVPGNILNDTPFYDGDTDQGTWPFVQPPSTYDQQVTVVTRNGCDTKYGAYQLLISGLTPYGYYHVQTAWSGASTFGYGFSGHANGYGQATYNWDCYGREGYRLPDGSYAVLVSDETGSANIIYLSVGDTHAK